MKPAKQPKVKISLWEQVKAEEKDTFFVYLEKKARNQNKKLKDIEKLEDDKKNNKELKPEQVEKV